MTNFAYLSQVTRTLLLVEMSAKLEAIKAHLEAEADVDGLGTNTEQEMLDKFFPQDPEPIGTPMGGGG